MHVTTEYSDLPFGQARQMIAACVDTADLVNLSLQLRFVLHSDAPSHASLTDRQSLKTQLRFYTRLRCLRELRALAWYLDEAHPDGVRIEVCGPLTAADGDFFAALCEHGNVQVTIVSGHGAPPPRSHNRTDTSLRVATERFSGAHLSEQDWDDLARVIGGYLNVGDSWSAMWLARAAMRNAMNPTPAALDAMGLAYLLQDRTGDAELLLRAAYGSTGLVKARAAYGLAMLYARHHPRALRDLGAARNLLDEGWTDLEAMRRSDETIREQVLNRNGLALILHREHDYKGASELLTKALGWLDEIETAGLHRSVLLHNLGRVYAQIPGQDDAAESALRSAIEADPTFAEYWLELGVFLARRGRYDEALEAAGKAREWSPTIPETAELHGALHALKGNHLDAAQEYTIAATLFPGKQSNILAAVREFEQADLYTEAATWLKRINTSDLTADEAAEFELLRLEARFNDGRQHDVAELRTELEDIALRYPNSDLVRASLQALDA